MQGLNSLAITFLPKNRRQTYFLSALGVILVAGAVLVWFRFFNEPSLPTIDTQSPPPKSVQIDFAVFESRVFQDLGALLPPIPFPDEIGKRDPFLPSE